MQGGIEHLALRLRSKQIFHQRVIRRVYGKRLEQAIDTEEVSTEIEVKRAFPGDLAHRDTDRFGWPHSIVVSNQGVGDIKQPTVLLPRPAEFSSKIVQRQLRRLYDFL